MRDIFYIGLLLVACPMFSQAQDEKPENDPTAPSELLEQTKEKIRQVAEFDKLQREYETLKAAKLAADATHAEEIKRLKLEKSQTEERMNTQIEQLKTSAAESERQLESEIQQLKILIQSMQQKDEEKSVDLPEFSLKSRMISDENSVVLLEFDGKSVFFRQGQTTRVMLPNSKLTPMLIRGITKDLVELEFPELDRSLVLY